MADTMKKTLTQEAIRNRDFRASRFALRASRFALRASRDGAGASCLEDAQAFRAGLEGAAP